MSTQDTQGELWEVFIQSKAGTPYKHAGSVHAYDKNMALNNAKDTYTRRGEGTGLWVVPSKEIAAVTVLEDASFFETTDDKIYRHPTFYELPKGVTNM